MTPRGLSCRFKIISGPTIAATGWPARSPYLGGCAGAIGFAAGVVTRCRITNAPMRDTVTKAVARRHLAGDALQVGGKKMCEEQAARMKKLEDAVTRQAAEIDALNSLVADLMVAHTMSNGDVRPLNVLRGYADFAQKRVLEGGTRHIPKDFFEARCAAYASVLQHIFESELPSRYWVRSAWEWLDNRRYGANLRMRKAIERIADWPS